MHIIRILGCATLLSSVPALATPCYTFDENCSGAWQARNQTSELQCYVIFWGGGNSTKNFCLQPGETETEQVRTGDTFCREQKYTPYLDTCVHRPMIVE